ncbi:MAG TPA: lytic transglycosylase domain-containing protein [Pararhizobium sp.]|jgi:hypothetical protein|nr:lytic transglycosylase domain-containing protein [Pararhizobium sp.]
MIGLAGSRSAWGSAVAAMAVLPLLANIAWAGPAPASAPKKPAIACEKLGDSPAFGRLPVCIAKADYDHDLCTAIEDLARRQDLPPGFFARLIWQESRFDPNAVSVKGAEGVAQFIPSTARLRGLADAFNPADALAKSAAYLHEMQLEFGNLGLAAVGYNAGENRALSLINSGTPVPAETAHYVFVITGLPVSAWTNGKPKTVDYKLADGKSFYDSCMALAKKKAAPSMLASQSPDWKPWGAEIGGSFSPEIARRIFRSVQADHPKLLGDEKPMLVRARNLSFGTRARYTVRIGRDSRSGAEKLCGRITATGGYCIVRKN